MTLLVDCGNEVRHSSFHRRHRDRFYLMLRAGAVPVEFLRRGIIVLREFQNFMKLFIVRVSDRVHAVGLCLEGLSILFGVGDACFPFIDLIASFKTGSYACYEL